eukprot:768625-Lingulodinium_polyedra.AAC.1
MTDINTRLADGRPPINIAPGSVGHLRGDKRARDVTKAARQNGRKPPYEKRPHPFRVSGVGNRSQACHSDCRLP